jgi:hypothetical protein
VTKTDEIMYIDRDGCYGDASGMIILNVSDLGSGGREKLERVKDSAANLLDWVMGYIEVHDVDIQLHLIGKSGLVFHDSINDESGQDFNKMIAQNSMQRLEEA